MGTKLPVTTTVAPEVKRLLGANGRSMAATVHKAILVYLREHDTPTVNLPELAMRKALEELDDHDLKAARETLKNALWECTI
ncbi:hypothetical protein [Falsiruegeria litorea]|uniref:hypothetical protein n=1 Tax=Falsiruegeria litorea TaxID=1280831 RepID=UPI001BFD87D0|nr:hypothetical protein [Falsiruegeria litorea]MBT8169676.1 hypothetical protein [Falsiruegeria litorea]